MPQFEYKQFYKRNRPHIHPTDSILFVTFRLSGSVTKAVVNRYKLEKQWLESELAKSERRERRESKSISDDVDPKMDFHRKWFARFESIMDKAKNGPMWLARDDVRKIVADKLVEMGRADFRLDAFSIMSNHAHVVFKPNISEKELVEKRVEGRLCFVSSEKTLSQIMQGIKGGTARKANSTLIRSGPFWEKESFDHFVRNEAEFSRIVRYTLNNPVKAGLVSHWKEWPGNYLPPRLYELFA